MTSSLFEEDVELEKKVSSALMICIDVKAVACCRYDGPKIQRIKSKEYMATYKGCGWFNNLFPRLWTEATSR